MLFYKSSKWLQHFDFRSSLYARPTQRWVCGWAAEGRPCVIGPAGVGRCRATFECRPVRKGDRWMCARPDSGGGRCAEAPLPDGTCAHAILPCNPVLSLRARRGLAARWLSALTVGAMLLLIGGAYGLDALSSGDLTTQHAEIRACGVCHKTFDQGPAHWMMSAFAVDTEVDDSRLCVSCHALGAHPLKPHNQVPADLWETSQRGGPPSAEGTASLLLEFADILFDPGQNLDGPLACRTCHREHKGKNSGLTRMANDRCQACHRTKFANLSEGHPEFGRYPFKRRTRLAFDHTSHLVKHFRDDKKKARAPTQCRSCHAPDIAGRTMRVSGFESACATCHAGQIEGEGRAGTKGMAVFTVPGLDLEVLREREIAIGEWPEDAEGEVSPFMDFLLSRSAEYVAAQTVLEDVDLLDLSDADDAQLEAVARLAWSVKGLLFDLKMDGMAGLEVRLGEAMGRSLTKRDLVQLSGLLPVDSIRSAQGEWFPNVLSEVTRHRAGESVPIPGGDEEVAPAPAPRATVAAKDGDDDILAGDDDQGKTDDDDILAGDDDQGKMDDDDILAEDESDAPAPSAAARQAVDTEPLAAMPTPIPDDQWAAGGGWYRDEFSLIYQPWGHADGFLRAWLNVSAGASGLAGESVARDIFRSLSAPRAPGVCIKCHSVDASADGTLSVNWIGSRPDTHHQPFTRFSHTSHFSLLEEKGCLTCHTTDADADFQSGFKGNDPTTYASNFKPVDRLFCAQCHTSELAGDACTACHNYHVGDFPPAIASVPEEAEGATASTMR